MARSTPCPASAPRSRPAPALSGTLLCVSTACAAASVAQPPRVALVPTDALGVAAEDVALLDRSLAEALRQRQDLRLAELGPRVDPAPASQCFDDDQCLTELGEAAGVDRVLALRLAGLGDTHVVRARLLDPRAGLVVQDLQETVVGERDALAALPPRLLERLFVPPARPWYRQWWLWGVAAVVAAGAVTTVAIFATRADDEGAIHLGEL